MKTSRLLTCLSFAVCLTAMSPVLAQQPATSPAPAAMAPSAPAPTQAPAATTAPANTPATVLDPDATKGPTVTVHELSPLSMFMNADIVVKLVMIGLALASLTTWTILFAKSRELFVAQRRLQAALNAITNSHSLAEARMATSSKKTALSLFVAAAIYEVRMSSGIPSDGGIKERAASSFAEISRREGRRMRNGMGLLATIGATSPFIGLFGTVWGIMNSFIGISKSQTTNLAVVAPGIAEALLATACGLIAAIPAVIIYNHFARSTKRYLEMVSQASGAAGRLLSRDLDRGHTATVSHAAE